MTNRISNHIKMKTQSIIILLFATLVIVSCSQPTDDLQAKKDELEAAKAELQELKSTISSLTKEIEAQDPDFFKSSQSAIRVTSIPAAKTHFEHKIEVRGSVMSRTNVQVGSELPGILTSVRVKEGQQVRKGQVLATINKEDIERNIATTETQLSFAKTVFEKRDRLWKKNIGTEIQYLEAKNNKETLERQLESLKTQLKKTSIVAPISGTIEQVPVKNGQYVQPGFPVVFLVNNANNYVSAEVSEAFVGRFEKGDEVTVNIPSLGDNFSSTIASIGQVINEGSRTFTVEVALPRGNEYKTNTVTLLSLTDYSSEESIVIPSRIIQEDIKGNFVYLIEGDKAKKVHVQLGLSYENQTQVLTGLNGGETIVDKGNRAVADGTTITIQN